MNLQEAILIRDKNKHLIGTPTEKGCTIGDVIIVPIDPEQYTRFMRMYVFNDYNADVAILPFANEDLRVMWIDKEHLRRDGVLFYDFIS